MRANEHYIGDGVYASFDGMHIWLRTDRGGVDHMIALEAPVLDQLLQFAERVSKGEVKLST